MAGSVSEAKVMGNIGTVGIRATVLAPFYYHSVAVPSGTATLPDFIGDRAMSFAIAAGLGCLSRSPALPEMNYLKHMSALPGLASLFETDEPRLMRPLGKRLNIDAELGFSKPIQDATSTGNLKTWFFVQEIPVETVYHGAYFGVDPFELASESEGRPVSNIHIRVGRHLSGLLKLEKADVDAVRLNAHTALAFGKDVGDSGVRVERYAMHDMQPTVQVPISVASKMVDSWRRPTRAA
jgi:hypothetical protein